MHGLGIEGVIKKSRYESQCVWYKPWTWFKKPVHVIEDFELRSISLVSRPVQDCLVCRTDKDV